MAKKASLLIRQDLVYRHDAFKAGLQNLGYSVTNDAIPDADVVVIWNRYGARHFYAKEQEARGAKVLVAENGYLGKAWRGQTWLALALAHHNGAGRFQAAHGPARWRQYGMPLVPYRPRADASTKALVLPQRGIGEPGVAMPRDWTQVAIKRLRQWKVPYFVRNHPGERGAAKDLYAEFAQCDFVVTWGSGAAIKALAAGVPVLYDFEQWIGKKAARRFSEENIFNLNTSEKDRLSMFEDLICAMAPIEEIANGEAFARLLELP